MTNDVIKTSVIGKSNISVGRFTYGFENLFIRQWNEGAALKIGAFCSLADNINIFLGGNHRTDWITTFPFGHIYQKELGGSEVVGGVSTKGDVVIGNDVWIGSGVTIMSGISIGDGAVISANACVVKDVAPYHIVAGNPAKSVKQRFDDEIVNLLLKLKWWELPLEDIKKIRNILSSEPDKSILFELISNKKFVESRIDNFMIYFDICFLQEKIKKLSNKLKSKFSVEYALHSALSEKSERLDQVSKDLIERTQDLVETRQLLIERTQKLEQCIKDYSK